MMASNLILFRRTSFRAIQQLQRRTLLSQRCYISRNSKCFCAKLSYKTRSFSSSSSSAPPPGEQPSDPTFEVEEDVNSIELDRGQYTEEIKIRMPDMSEGENKILKWYKKEGDIIKRKDVLCDIETPDFVFGLETEDEEIAIMGKIHVPASSDHVPDEEVICIILHKGKEAENDPKKDDKSEDV